MKHDEWVAMCVENGATETRAIVMEGAEYLEAIVGGRRRRWKLE